MTRNRNLEALAMLGGAIGTGATIVLYAIGETKAAAAIGVTGLLVGSVIGAARLLSDDEDTSSTHAAGASLP